MGWRNVSLRSSTWRFSHRHCFCHYDCGQWNVNYTETCSWPSAVQGGESGHGLGLGWLCSVLFCRLPDLLGQVKIRQYCHSSNWKMVEQTRSLSFQPRSATRCLSLFCLLIFSTQKKGVHADGTTVTRQLSRVPWNLTLISFLELDCYIVQHICPQCQQPTSIFRRTCMR